MTKLKNLQSAELKLAISFSEFCKKNNLRYYMIGGTLLGAVRHKGFIPWDDDMDFGMPREDYEKMKKLLLSKGNYKMEVQSYSVNPKYKYAFVKIVDNSIDLLIETGIEKQIVPAWIDIFPIDYVPNNFLVKKLHLLSLLWTRALISLNNIDRIDFTKKERPLREKVLMWIGKKIQFSKFLNLNKLYEKLNKKLMRFNEEDGDLWLNIMGSYKDKEIFSKEVFGKGILYSFEDTAFFGPEKGNEYLTKLYGDYMTPPQDKNHHKSTILEDK
jgi:lipopolysaccharide cholinephosphotransferase